jgi:(4-(4-[2-(gamma-L-glutamylamino)ethyl]phenoxymethyl)furan-2-yl)methanamine synthase
MTTQVLGLDIGGANLKAAHSEGAARTVAFPLWKHPECLSTELVRLCGPMPSHDRLAVTMTGELCDCYETKREGVTAILQSVRAMAGTTPIHVWTTRGRFVEVAAAFDDPTSVAAANWLALAHQVARWNPQECALLIDTGSTTTDIVYLGRGRPEPRGLTDSARMAAGELVYTGVRRTPICAVLGMSVAAEFFATMLDAYVWAGLVREDADDHDTADGRPATRGFARARLARMLCADADTFSERDADELAKRALRMQWQAAEQAIERVVADRPVDRFVIAGSGEILGRSVVARRWPTTPLTSLGERLGPELSQAACAYAVACEASAADDA